MRWDGDLRQLSKLVRDTFGERVWTDAINRALVATKQAAPDDPDVPFDAAAVCKDALKAELRRLLQPH